MSTPGCTSPRCASSLSDTPSANLRSSRTATRSGLAPIKRSASLPSPLKHRLHLRHSLRVRPRSRLALTAQTGPRQRSTGSCRSTVRTRATWRGPGSLARRTSRNALGFNARMSGMPSDQLDRDSKQSRAVVPGVRVLSTADVRRRASRIADAHRVQSSASIRATRRYGSCLARTASRSSCPRARSYGRLSKDGLERRSRRCARRTRSTASRGSCTGGCVAG